jgi:ABC-2 type transport system permease protein
MNSTTLEVGTDLIRGPAKPRRRLWRAYLTEARYESVRMLRAPGFAFPFLLLPVALYLFFGVVMGATKDPKIGLQVFTGFAVFGVMGPGMFGFGMVLAVERERGLLTLKRALPMPAAANLTAKMFMAMLFSVIIMVTLIAAALSIGHLTLGVGRGFAITTILTLGSLPFSAIGLFIGARATSRTAPAFVNLIYLPMIYLSSILIPLPKSIQAISLMSPAFYLNQLVLRALGAPTYGALITDVGVLAGVTLLLSAFAVRRLARVG